MTATANEQTSARKKPTHAIFHVRDREGKKSIWTRIGSAIAHADGKGFSGKIDVVPLNGEFTVRVVTEKNA